MTRVVAVSRVLDEADVIEPFLRHTATLVDHHIVLDNGSRDGTVEIMRALQDEGLSLEAYQAAAPVFLEQVHNTGLYRLALAAGADWVLFLDADELLVVHGADRPGAVLAMVPEGIPCVRVWAYRYERPSPGPGQHAFEALVRRDEAPEMPKIAVRRTDPARISVYAGNHFAFVDGREDPGLSQDRLGIAHVPDRNPLQLARKVIGSRMKAIASGTAAAAHFSVHRLDDYTALQQDARAWLAARETVAPAPVADPVAYRGGTLRHTRPVDELARLLEVTSVQVEALARSHGDIMDRKRLLRRELQERGSQARRLF